MDEQIFHSFEQGSVWLSREQRCPTSGQNTLLPQEGLTLTWYQLEVKEVGDAGW